MNPSLITLGIAAFATCLSLTTKEEIVKVFTASIAVLMGFIALCYTPWMVMSIVAVPLVLDRMNYWSSGI